MKPLSTAKRGKSLAKYLGLAGAASLLASCAVVTPVAITSTQGGLTADSSIKLVEFESDGSLRGAFGPALVQSLAEHDVPLDNDALRIADFAIAVRPAGTGIADPAASNAENVVWDSLPSESRWYDECRAQRLRATLVVLDSADSTIVYRGVAESDVCEYSQADFRALADALVQDAL